MRLSILGAAFALTGCATTSFAPPQVDVHAKMTNQSLGAQCKVRLGATTTILPDVDGAQTLIDNYLDSYRCVAREAANGRQPWQILSFLSLVGSTTAIALGAGRNIAILGGAGNSVFNSGNSYYAPREQAEILNQAVDALACIQTESVGIDPYALNKWPATQTLALNDGEPSIGVSVKRQYFNMVSSALISVERAAAHRLAGRGSFDPAGVAAQVEALAKKIQEAEDAKKKPPPTAVGLYAGLEPVTASALQDTQLSLSVVQAKLQKCALRAQG